MTELTDSYAAAEACFEAAGGYELETRLTMVLAGLDLADVPRDLPVQLLSGGQKTRLGLAKLLIQQPQLLLLDEPSLGLAPIIIQQIFDIIRKINHDNNTTIFLVEQNANQALKLADRGYVMENGRITLTDTAENLLDNEQVKKAYLGL